MKKYTASVFAKPHVLFMILPSVSPSPVLSSSWVRLFWFALMIFFWVRISCIPGLILNFSSFCFHPSWVLGLYAYTTTPNHVIKPRSSYIADNLPNKMKLQFHASAFYVCYWECSQFLVSWTPQRNSQCITWTSGSSVEESKRNQKDKIQ